MARSLAGLSKPRLLWSLRLLLIASFLLAGQVAFPHQAGAAVIATDSFNRANGSLGAGWTATSDGAMSISSQQVTGIAGMDTGEIRTGESYPSDQFSQITISSTPLSGSQWVATAVRMQTSGQNLYAGLYYWNFGSPELMLFKRTGGAWTQLGAYSSGVLAAGTLLQVTAAGSTISVQQNGITRITVTDSALTGGAPGIMAYGNGFLDTWSGGSATSGGSTYSVGGTVSGLSGTVVLQDNGGDNLSVSGNGSFTFATALAAGAAYNVTVLTSPAGQTCTVSGGSGTIGSANVTNIAITCTTSGGGGGGGGGNGETVIATDNFNRANGSLGAGWTATSDGAMSISSQQVTGIAGQDSGEVRTGESYPSDQFSQITISSTPLSGSQWVATAVRMQASGQDAYAGLYYWNFGSPELLLFVRDNGGWAQLGSSYNSGVLAAGTQLQIAAVGSTIALFVNGVQRLTATNTTLTGGAPGFMASGNGDLDTWSGGSATSGILTSYSVGGSVSGLSGTVVLQDNGSDTLNVTANGSFTFGTQLAGGAAYNATVLINPTEQTCTVANGTGAIGSANVTNIAITCTTSGGGGGGGGGNGETVIATDNFNRANGSLGAGWTATSDGAMSISSQQVTGIAGQDSGEVRTGESYPSDQFSQITISSTPLSGSQWVATAVRMQASGQDAYAGLYYWNSGSPELMLFLRSGGSWSQLGSYNSGVLAAGTQLQLVVVGNTISFQQNGVQRIGASDNSLTGGAPGIMAYGNGDLDSWSGGSAGFQASYASTDSSGIKYYNVISANNGDGPQTLRVLTPTSPAAGVAHNFLIVLPVEAGLGSSFGDGLATLQALNAQNQYDLTIVEPTFAIDSWDANNPNDPRLQYETFLTQELVPWIKQNLATTGQEQVWLIGFSKSGLGAQDLILKHPNLFTLAASWDFPADMATYDGLGSDPAANYGTDANYQANYRLTQAFVNQYEAPFLTSNRIWIGSYSLYQTDVSDYDALLTSAGIAHSTESPQYMAHRWDSGWMPTALAALYQDSLKQ